MYEIAGLSTERPIGLYRTTLKNISPNTENALIVGVIIAKQPPRKFQDSNPGSNGKDRGVWNFTLRDSPNDWINATLWALSDYAFHLNVKFQIGDVVEIERPLVKIRQVNDHGEQFRPLTTSPFSLLLNEQSQIKHYEGSNFADYLNLLQLPTKPLATFVALADVHRRVSADEAINGLDLLGAVSSVGNTRNIKTKSGKHMQVREVVIFDHTSSGLRFSIWESDQITRAGMWKPRVTILFLTDVRAEWSSFHRSATVTLTSRTIITENPIGPEADALRKYALHAPLQMSAIVENMVTSIPNPDSIQNVMSIKQIFDKIDFIMDQRGSETQFTALVYAVVTQMNLDDERVVKTKCTSCSALITAPMRKCENSECPVGSGAEYIEPYQTFDIRVWLSDHTATLDSCKLTGKAAESVLNYKLLEFMNLSSNDKSNLKWHFLGERCAVRLMVVALEGRNPVVSILGMSVASANEVAAKMPHY